jgi:hypothetical protein
MEGVHPLLFGLLPVQNKASSTLDTSRIPLATLPLVHDVLAATWEINKGLTESLDLNQRNADKQIANVLEALNLNRLAGASLYKEREREKPRPRSRRGYG